MELEDRPSTELRFEHRVLVFALLAPLPSVGILLYLLLRSEIDAPGVYILGGSLFAAWFALAWFARNSLVRPVQTLSNLLAALREGDLSIRARGARADDALGLALLEINTLGETLRNQRVGAQEASVLLQRVIDEIDVSLLAFDAQHRLRLINRTGQKLLGKGEDEVVGHPADELGLDDLLQGEAPRTLTRGLGGGTGRWELRRSNFRQGGRPHTLVVLADVTRALREEELQAWQRIIRVLSHELNNSLTPIKSIAGSLRDMVGAGELEAEDREDMMQGLGAIGERSASLSRFIASYARLARLPEPKPRDVDVGNLLDRVRAFDRRLDVQVEAGPPLSISADPDQLDQLLINLVRNAVDAAMEQGGGVQITWAKQEEMVEIRIADDGPGISDTANLFVPFFTTKPNGSGIGLALSRQIAEAHGGTLELENRRDREGAVARLRLPLR